MIDGMIHDDDLVKRFSRQSFHFKQTLYSDIKQYIYLFKAIVERWQEKKNRIPDLFQTGR